MKQSPDYERSVDQLRQEFDRSFAVPSSHAAPDVEDLIAIRLGGDPHAIRLRDISGMFAKRSIVSIPAAAPCLVGLAGVRGQIVPVFALAALLGYEDADSSPWMVLCGVEEPLALGFSEFEGYLRLPKTSLYLDEKQLETRQYVREVAATELGPRRVIDIPVVVATVRNRTQTGRQSKERYT